MRQGPTGRVRVEDVATVRRGHRDRQEITRSGGEEMVEIALHREGLSNTIAVAAAIREALNGPPERPDLGLRAQMDDDLELSFLTDQSVYILEADPQTMAAMVRGLNRSLQWLTAAPPETLADAIASYFPALARDLLSACIARYQTLQIWNETPVLSRDGFEQLKAACLAGGLITRDTPFETCVDNRHAEAAVAAGPPLM